MHRIFHNPVKKLQLMNAIVRVLEQYKFQGLNIDFEELTEEGDEPMIEFVKQLHEKLKEKSFLLTQDITPDNEDFNIPELPCR